MCFEFTLNGLCIVEGQKKFRSILKTSEYKAKQEECKYIPELKMLYSGTN